jgi:hypothetical protein
LAALVIAALNGRENTTPIIFIASHLRIPAIRPSAFDQIAKALSRFEAYTGCREFKRFHRKQAEAFKQHIAQQRSRRDNEPLSKATVYSTLTALKTFFTWLASPASNRGSATPMWSTST